MQLKIKHISNHKLPKVLFAAGSFVLLSFALIFSSPTFANERPQQNFEQIFATLEQKKTLDITGARQDLAYLLENYSKLNNLQKSKYRYYYAHSRTLAADFNEAIKVLKENIKTTKNPAWLAISHSLLSNTYSFQGKYNQSFKHLRKALKLRDRIKADEYIYFSVLQHAFNLYSESELYAKALDIGRIYAKEIKDKESYWGCASYLFMTTIEIQTDQLEMANKSIQAGLNSCMSVENQLMVHFGHELLASLFIKQNKLQAAKEALLEHESEAKKVGYQLLDIRFDLRLGEAYFLEKDFDNAKQRAEQAYTTAKTSGDKKHLKVASKLLANIASEQKDFETSVKFYNEFLELERQFKLQVAQRQLAYFKTRNR